jgi:KaiC/GvpD/RAD55 family RecA-like ATPase
MLRNSIEGLDSVIKSEIPRNSVILIAGSPGSLKSGMTYSMLSNHLKQTDEVGIYITLEESTLSHLKNMQSLNIEIPDNLIISDYTDIRDRFEKNKNPNIVDMIMTSINYFRNKYKERFTMMALDSLNALYALIDTSDLRVKMFHFLKGLRHLNVTSFIIMEIPEFNKLPEYMGSESFLVDGIIRTGDIETKQDVLLYMQVKKMRACNHSRKKHIVEVTDSGISILGPVVE